MSSVDNADRSDAGSGAPDVVGRGHGEGKRTNQPDAGYVIGGSITGLEGGGLILNNGSETLAVAAHANNFAFPTKVRGGTSFAVTVQTQPNGPTQECTVTGGTGTVVAGDVFSVAINCTTKSFTVGGNVVGLAGSGLVVTRTSDAGHQGGPNAVDLPINSVGTFAFPAQSSGSTYTVTVKTQPSNGKQDCVVENGTGTVVGADVTDITVTCKTKVFTVSGTVLGLVGTGLVLTNNGTDETTITSNGTFTFDTPIATGQSYLVAVKTPPSPHQDCVVKNGSGTMSNAAIIDVKVACKADAVYVDVAKGNNANTGGPTDPWRNVTYALAHAPAGPIDIIVAPGTYDTTAGEIFPIRPKSNQNIIGDIANKGGGLTPTVFSGQGPATYFGGDMASNTYPHGMFFGAGVENAAVRGIKIQVANGQGIGFNNAEATLEAVSGTGASDGDVIIANGSDVTITNCKFTANSNTTLLVVDPTTKLKMRGTTLSNAKASGRLLYVGLYTAFTGSNVDLGTTASPGGNTILGSTGGVGLLIANSSNGSRVQAVGNTWKPNVQGASNAGTYAGTSVDGSAAIPMQAGNNYAITWASAGSGIQF